MCRLLFMLEPLASNSNNSSNNNHSIQQREAETANKEVRMPFPYLNEMRAVALCAAACQSEERPSSAACTNGTCVIRLSFGSQQQQEWWPTKSAATTKHIETMNSRNCLAQSRNIRSDFCGTIATNDQNERLKKKNTLCTRSPPPTDSQLNCCRRFITFVIWYYTGIQHSTGYSINGILGIQHTTDPNGNSIKRKRIDGK